MIMQNNGLKDQDTGNRRSSGRKAAPPSANDAIDSITNQTRGLFEDLTSWMELKIQYVILDYQEQLTKKVKGAAFEIGALAIFGLGVLFGLVALALGLGVLLGHAGWGFLVVMLLLVLVALVVRAVGKRISRTDKRKSIDITEEKPTLTSPRIPDQLTAKNGKD